MVSGSAKEVETSLPDFDSVWKRIQQAAGIKKQYELAEALGIAGASISDAKNRGTFPLAWAYKLSSGLDISLDWILHGKEKDAPPQKPGRANRQQVREEHTPYGDQVAPHWPHHEDSDLIMVPKVRARLSAGNGSLETSSEVKARYAFRREWITGKGRHDQMVLMDVTGDSMEPAILERDVVLIDQSQVDIIPGAIYAIGIDDAVLIKFVDKEPGKLLLRSANKDYRPIEVDLKDESQNVRIIGRVVWWCREAR